MKKTTAVEIITVLYITLFLYTGLSKLMDFSVFKEQLAASTILKQIAVPVAAGLPVIEFLVVILLIVPRWRLKGLYISLGLMIVFTIYILAIFGFSKELPCSCGGLIQELSWPQHLFLNVIFIIMALAGIVFSKKIRIESQAKISSQLNRSILNYW